MYGRTFYIMKRSADYFKVTVLSRLLDTNSHSFKK